MITNLHYRDPRPEYSRPEEISEIISQNISSGFDIIRDCDADNPDLLYPTAFGSFVPYRRTTLICGEENAGKSILAMQITLAALRGGDRLFANHKTTFRAESALYIDTDLNDTMFASRYAYRNSHGLALPKNLYHFHPGVSCSKTHPDTASLVLDTVEEMLASNFTRFIVIDSITRLAQRSFGKFANVKYLMKRFLHLQDKYNATFIIVADNKKYAPTSRRPRFNPLTSDSNSLISFADSAVGITRSSFDVRHRYIKHIKLRGGETAYDENYVIDCIITPPSEKTDSEDGNFLSLRPGHLLKESQYEQQLNLPAQQIEEQKKQIISQILELHKEGKSLRSIAASVGLSKSTVHRHILDATAPDLAVPYLTFNPDSAVLEKSDTTDGTLLTERYEHDIPYFAHYPGDPEYNVDINKEDEESEDVIPENETDEQHLKRLEAQAERRFLNRRTPYTVVNPPHCPQPDDTPPLRAIPPHAKTVTHPGTTEKYTDNTCDGNYARLA